MQLRGWELGMEHQGEGGAGRGLSLQAPKPRMGSRGGSAPSSRLRRGSDAWKQAAGHPRLELKGGCQRDTENAWPVTLDEM